MCRRRMFMFFFNFFFKERLCINNHSLTGDYQLKRKSQVIVRNSASASPHNYVMRVLNNYKTNLITC